MIENNYTFRVVYADTDKMGIVHHSNYVKYYESARWELMRNLGVPYRSIEEAGYLLPVIRMNYRCVKTTFYDDCLTIKTVLTAAEGVRLWFTYKMYNERNELVNEAETELAFVDANTWKPVAIPAFIRNAIEERQHAICNKELASPLGKL